jgi:hypothetical protein
MKGIRCLNCDHMVYEKFCPNCGQKGDTKRIDWHFLFHDIPHSILHLDKGFLYTSKKLFLNPGAAVREFLDGKRVRHFRPLAYVIILGIVMTLGVKTDGIEPGAVTMDAQMEEEDFQVSGETITYVLGKYYAFLVIACIPIYAFISWVLNRKERNFVEIFTGFLFIFGHTTWFGLGLILIRLVDNEILEKYWSRALVGGYFYLLDVGIDFHVYSIPIVETSAQCYYNFFTRFYYRRICAVDGAFLLRSNGRSLKGYT